jgi:hypothetical protein
MTDPILAQKLTACWLVHSGRRQVHLHFAELLQLLVLYHLISALPDLFYIGFRPVEVPSHPDGYFHVKKQGGFEPPCWVGQVSQTVNHIVSLCARFHRRARS